MSEEPGSERVVAGRYRLLSPLGEGGMGTVWRARDEVLHREVAVKEVRAPAGLPAADVERMYARLEREAWAAARITDRNVVTVYDVATEDGRPWIVMELVRGLSLADVLDAEGPLDPRRAAHVGAEVLAALRAAHGAGVLRRDVKPANVLIANDGRIVLTDFGIAVVEGSSALTVTGEVVGSPEFLAPERALGRTPARVGPVVARRTAVRVGGGLFAVPSGHPAEHPAGGRRRGTAAAAPGRAAGPGRRRAVAQGPGRAAAGGAGAAGPAARRRRGCPLPGRHVPRRHGEGGAVQPHRHHASPPARGRCLSPAPGADPDAGSRGHRNHPSRARPPSWSRAWPYWSWHWPG